MSTSNFSSINNYLPSQTAIDATTTSLSQYHASAMEETYRLDGEQKFFVGAMIAQRATALEAQLRVAGVDTNGWISTSMSIAFLSYALIVPLIPPLVDNVFPEIFPKSFNENVIVIAAGNLLAASATTIAELFDFLFLTGSSGRLFDVVCAVAYIACIAFGHTLVGGLGLAGLCLAEIKKQGYLPGFIDDTLVPLSLFSQVYTTLLVPTFLPLKLLNLAAQGMIVIDFLSKKPLLQPYLPKWMTPAIFGEHTIDETRSLKKFCKYIQTEQGNVKLQFDKNIFLKENFLSQLRMNTSHIHNENVTKIFTPKDITHLDEQQFKALFPAIEERWAELTDDQRAELTADNKRVVLLKNLREYEASWERMRRCLVHDRTTDQRPLNPEAFNRVMKIALTSILSSEDDDQFISGVKNLLEVGRNCIEGWTRDLTTCYDPQPTEDFEWGIHYILSKFRGQLITHHTLLTLSEIAPPPGSNADKIIGPVTYGGTNNVHVHNQVQLALRRELRSREAENRAAQGEQGFLSTYLSSLGVHDFYQLTEAGSGVNLPIFEPPRELLEYIRLNNSIVLPLPMKHLLVPTIEGKVKLDYTKEAIIDHVYDKLDPLSDFKSDVIPFETIQHWMANPKTPGLSEYLEVNYFNYVEQIKVGETENGNNVEKPRLTKKGVELFLWDLGILELASESELYTQEDQQRRLGYKTDDKQVMLKRIAQEIQNCFSRESGPALS